ncbi:hypothetical protein M408DRAFT_316725 [Serendipita vermifera MAFF 305830]|uniref:Uncharacterized protein n=1 Tax=Serendipita vermifera MAFF 305830 TaxID=933852 RepID=A0A0C2WEV8_SERVB|nr:hypothetical protein M408DRAFT_316725 [Serendipita vermifera MAFF 305830]
MSTSAFHFEDDKTSSMSNEMATVRPSNHAPTQLEREMIKQRISLSEKKTNVYYLKIAECRDLIAQLEDLVAKETRERLILQGTLSALRRVPNEAQSRETVTSTYHYSHKIWTRIQLCHRAIPEPILRYQNGREICDNVSRLRAALVRSGKTLLDIEVLGFDQDMAREILQERSRWDSFHMGNQSYDHSLMQWLMTEALLPAFLEKVTFSGIAPHEYIRQFLNLAQPVSLSLPNPCDLQGLALTTWSTRLRKLHVFNLQDPTHLIAILKMTSHQLISLSLSQIRFSPEILEDFIFFPNLLELSLVDTNGWWEYSAPKVRIVTLASPGNLPDKTVAIYPDLKRLTLSPYKSSFPPDSIFAFGLESLTLQQASPDGKGSFLTLLPGCFQHPSEMRLQHLCIKECFIPFRELIDSLRLLKFLQKLDITNTSLPVSFYKAFAIIQGGGLLCPLLRAMIIDLTRCKIVIKETFSAAFWEILKVRGPFMVEFNVSWPEKWGLPPTHFI